MLPQQFTPSVADLGAAIDRLRALDVSPKRIADAFETSLNEWRTARGEIADAVVTPGNIKVIRTRFHQRRASRALPRLDWAKLRSPSSERRKDFGIRLKPDEVDGRERAEPILNQIEQVLERVRSECGGGFRCDEAILRLRPLLSKIGYPADTHRIRFKAQIHQSLGWFNVHSGRTRSAVSHAEEAAYLFSYAHRQSGDSQDLVRLAEASHISAHAHALAREPESVMHTLGIEREALKQASERPGAEYFRLRGVALFQLGEQFDGDAAAAFSKAAEETQVRLGRDHIQVEMDGARHTNVLGRPQPDNAYALRRRAADEFGPTALQASMTSHWAAVASLVSDDPVEHVRAYECVKKNRPVAAQFGHQSSIALMLDATPRLHLDDARRRNWARFVLYVNAFTDD